MYRRGMYRAPPTHTHPVRAPSPQLPYTESIGGLSDVKFAPPDCIHMRRFGRGFKAAEQQEEKGDGDTQIMVYGDRKRGRWRGGAGHSLFKSNAALKGHFGAAGRVPT